MPLCLLPIKLPLGFSSSLRWSTRHYSFLMKLNQQSSLCCQTVRAGLYNFHSVNSVFYVCPVLTANKAMVSFHSSMRCHTKHYSLLADKSHKHTHRTPRTHATHAHTTRARTTRRHHTHHTTRVHACTHHTYI
jgi:hypothetical protein